MHRKKNVHQEMTAKQFRQNLTHRNDPLVRGGDRRIMDWFLACGMGIFLGIFMPHQ